jgi:hypothetical protein
MSTPEASASSCQNDKRPLIFREAILIDALFFCGKSAVVIGMVDSYVVWTGRVGVQRFGLWDLVPGSLHFGWG